MHVIPQSWAHLHILVSLLPSVGLVFALGLYVVAFVTKNEPIKRFCLIIFGFLALLAIPTYLSGTYSMASLSGNPRIWADMLDAHFGWAMWTLGLLIATGAVAMYELWRSRNSHLSVDALHLVLGLAFITFGLMAVVNELGWQVNH